MLPKFSLRLILILVTASSALSAILARAVAGDAWAIGVSAAFLWMGLALLVHAVFYVLAVVFGRLGHASATADEQDATREGIH